MKGVRFGDYHSWDNFSLILAQKTIGAPSAKVETIDIPGADGVLDATDFFGEPKYNNRTLSFEFSTIVPPGEFMNLFSRILNTLHGQKLKITLDDDPDWFYTGRIDVPEWKAERNIGKLTIDCDCEPYKMKQHDTVITETVSTEKTVILSNSKKAVVPTIDITGEINLTFGDNYYSLGAGRYDLPGVQLKHGDNTILLDGTGTATFTYRERGL